MATEAISGLPTASSVSGSDIAVINQSGTTKTAALSLIAGLATGGGSGGITAAAGVPRGAGTVGQFAASSDGVPGALLFGYVTSGVFPIPINWGVYALGLAAAGVATVPMMRGTTSGSLLISFLTQTSTIQATLNTGWTSIYLNNGPTPVIEAAWAWAVGGAADTKPYTLTSTEPGCITILEIANANTSSPIASSYNGYQGNTFAPSANQLVVACVSMLYPTPLATPPGWMKTQMVNAKTINSSQQLIAAPFVVPLIAANTNDVATFGPTLNLTTGFVAIAPGSATENYWAPIG